MQLINDHEARARSGAREVDESATLSLHREPIQTRWAVHPILFAAFPILSLFAQNAREVHVMDLARLLGVVLAGTLMLYLVLVVLMRNAAKAALIASVAVLFFFTMDVSKHAVDSVLTYWSRSWVLRFFDIDLLWIVVPEMIALGLAAYAIRTNWSATGTITSYLNVFSLVLVALPIAQVASIKASTIGRPPHEPVPFAVAAKPGAAQLPDIYYIILDGYARTDVMKTFFDFDNAPFLNRLEKQGFYIARDSIANYCQTPLSLSASLNSVYLDDLVKGLGPDQTQLTDLIGKNNLLATLRPLGYKFVTFATGFDPTEHPEADVYLSPHPFATGFERMVIDITPLRRVWPNPRSSQPKDLSRERTFYLLDHLSDVARDRSPTFTFAHVFCPHPPFVFGEKGEDVSLRYKNYSLVGADRTNGRFRDPPEFARAYRNQAAFITERIEATIKQILTQSPEPPIIILQSDHGSELNLDMNDVGNTDLKERMSILNAYYFPGGKYGRLHRGISPVNSFRVVLNTFFGADLPLLPDQSYFSTWSEPYQFIDVTRAVRLPDDGAGTRADSLP